jgi:hypothetical protein
MVLLYSSGTNTRVSGATVTVTRMGYVFGALLVVMMHASTVAYIPYCASVQVATAFRHSAFAGYPVAFTGPFGPPAELQTGVLVNTCIIPLGTLATTATTSKMKLRVWSTSTKVAALSVYGLTSNPGVTIRGDGRAFPVGALHAYATSLATGTTTVIAAPATPLHILISGIKLHGATTASARVYSTGVTTLAAIIKPAYQMIPPIPARGLLLKANKAVTMKLTAAKRAVCSIDYDLVV